jgi:uncharacterized protein (TIGR02757 family)
VKPERFQHLQSLLESAYVDFHSHYYRGHDPVSLVHGLGDPKDQEIAAVFAAVLAYGNVATILASVRRVLSALGPSPHDRVRYGEFPEPLRSFRHRFTTGEDLEILFHWLQSALRSHGSVESFFHAAAPARAGSMRERLAGFVSRFCAQPLPPHLQAIHPRRERNLKYLLPSPDRGSACKRLNMFLRWMVRAADGIDLGLWAGLRPEQLVLPIDTHLLQTLRALRWTRSRQATWLVAERATERLRMFCPQDPTRYDFALCHLSMAGGNIREYGEKRHATLER